MGRGREEGGERERKRDRQTGGQRQKHTETETKTERITVDKYMHNLSGRQAQRALSLNFNVFHLVCLQR